VGVTILCITTSGLPGIRPCTHRGQHRVTCLDHEGWAASIRPGECNGCLPRSADRGYLCQWCYEKLDAAHLKWRTFAQLVLETDGRAVSADGGGIKGSTPDGYTNLPLTVLALDECTRLLRSQAGLTLDAWVHTEAGARDAIMFAHAAERAYRSLEVEERELQLERVRCPKCDQFALWAGGNQTRKVHGATVVTCGNCGELLDRIRDDSPRWIGSDPCRDEHHLACTELACGCVCHDIGARSRPQGIPALWDADLAAVTGWRDRTLWVWDGETFRPQTDERKTA
jgi:hypothetical protein